MPRGGGSSQPGLPTDYGGGGIASSGAGTVNGHLVTPPSRMPGNGGNEGKPGSLARILPPAPKATLPASALMSPAQVRAMQQFLNNHGFQVAQDGIMGPLTKSAAAAFRANHKGGEEWNAAHGIGVHPAAKAAVTPARNTAGAGAGTGAGTGTGTGVDSTGSISQLLQAMLSGGGNVGVGYDPQDFGNAAAAPDVAQAAAIQRQINANPGQETQDQADISNWYGLDPKASSYKLSVLGRLAQAKAADAGATTSIQNNMGDLAQALAGSIGGSANDGSGSVLAAGQNDAGTIAALGQAQSDYESNMDPLLRAEAVGAASKEKATNSQALQALQDSLAQAQGQAAADRATGVMGAQDKNNSLAQQRFANQGNLLSTLAQMQAADPNAPTLANAKTKAQIAEIDAQAAKARAAAHHLVTGAATTPPKVNVGDVFNKVASMLNIPSGSVNLPSGTSLGGIAHLIGSALQGSGIPKSDPRYQRLGQAILASFKDSSGNPLSVPAGWFGPNTQ